VTTVNPRFPSDIEVADLSAIPTLLTIGQELAATLDWTKLIP